VELLTAPPPSSPWPGGSARWARAKVALKAIPCRGQVTVAVRREGVFEPVAHRTPCICYQDPRPERIF
jgi:hypothetical protein